MRILSLAPSNTEILFALGLDEEIVGVTHLCDWPPSAQSKAKVGTWINTDPEKIAALKPDLIFTSYFIPEDLRRWSGPGEIVHVAPKTLEGVYDSILKIGEVVGTLEKAKGIVYMMKEELSILAASVDFSPRPRVYMEEWHDPPMASGNWVPEIVEIAGGVAGVSKSGEASAPFPFDELVSFDPDLLVFHWCGIRESVFSKLISRRPNVWQKLHAMRYGSTVFIEDALLNRPGPRLVEGARRLRDVMKSFFVDHASRHEKPLSVI